MLEKPDIDEGLICSHLLHEFGVHFSQLAFLPLGYDVSSAVYRAVAEDGKAYFLKLRKGDFNEIAVAVPRMLKTHGVRAIIAPIKTRSRRLWSRIGDYYTILYPFIEGKNGYEAALTRRQWRALGVALRRIHHAKIPRKLAARIPRETFSPQYREMISLFQEMVEHVVFADPVAQRLAAFIRSQREVISRLVSRAEELAAALQSRPLNMVLCHADLHAGNLLLAEKGELYIVDWDAPLFAPQEKDLALVGGCPTWNNPLEVAQFYRGYKGEGPLQVDAAALAYYRCERAITDIAEFCGQLLLTDAGGADREQSYNYCAGLFLPGHEIELALATNSGLVHARRP